MLEFESVGHKEFRAWQAPKTSGDEENLATTEIIDTDDPGPTLQTDLNELPPTEILEMPRQRNKYQGIEIGSDLQKQLQEAWEANAANRENERTRAKERLALLQESRILREAKSFAQEATELREKINTIKKLWNIPENLPYTIDQDTSKGDLHCLAQYIKECTRSSDRKVRKEHSMQQGQGGDCYAISALEAIKGNPDAFERVLQNCKKNEDGTYSFKFFNDLVGQGGQWIEITVKEEDIGDGPKAPLHGNLGDKLLERAYHSFVSRQRTQEIGNTQVLHKVELKQKETWIGKMKKSLGMKDTPKYEERLVWEGGFPEKSLYHMLGPDYQKYNAKGKEKMLEAMQDIFSDGQSGDNNIIATLYTGSHFPVPGLENKLKFWEKKTPGDIYPRHAYTLGNIDYSAEKVQIINPHNTQKTIEISFDELFKYFTNITYVRKQEDGIAALNQTIYH